MKKTICFYITPTGKMPVEHWLEKLKDRIAVARIKRRLERIQEGFYGDYKSVGGGLFELRIDVGPGYRIYFIEQDAEVILLLCGGDKSTQNKDIETAQTYLKDLKRKEVNDEKTRKR